MDCRCRLVCDHSGGRVPRCRIAARPRLARLTGAGGTACAGSIRPSVLLDDSDRNSSVHPLDDVDQIVHVQGQIQAGRGSGRPGLADRGAIGKPQEGKHGAELRTFLQQPRPVRLEHGNVPERQHLACRSIRCRGSTLPRSRELPAGRDLEPLGQADLTQNGPQLVIAADHLNRQAIGSRIARGGSSRRSSRRLTWRESVSTAVASGIARSTPREHRSSSA